MDIGLVSNRDVRLQYQERLSIQRMVRRMSVVGIHRKLIFGKNKRRSMLRKEHH